MCLLPLAGKSNTGRRELRRHQISAGVKRLKKIFG